MSLGLVKLLAEIEAAGLSLIDQQLEIVSGAGPQGGAAA
jgi:hypothetical protein